MSDQGDGDNDRYECGYCLGSGFFTETVEGSDGRDTDVDYICSACDGTGEDR